MSETDKYRRSGRPGIGGTKTGGESKYSLIFSNAIWQSSFQTVGWFFLNRRKMGSHMSVNLAMKWLKYYNLPRKPLISFSVLGTGMSSMALILSGSTSMHRSMTICTNNLEWRLSVWIWEDQGVFAFSSCFSASYARTSTSSISVSFRHGLGMYVSSDWWLREGTGYLLPE